MEPLAQLQSHLRPDEQLLWHGQPDPQVWLAPADVFLIPFSVMWCSFAIFWESGVVNGGGPTFAEVWGIPFIAIGAYIVFGRFMYKRYRKKRTAYGVTTRRAVIASPGSLADIPWQHQALTIRRTRDSRHATVIIGNTAASGRGSSFRQGSARFYTNTGMEPFARSIDQPFAFYDVADADSMLQALEQARSQPTA